MAKVIGFLARGEHEKIINIFGVDFGYDRKLRQIEQ